VKLAESSRELPVDVIRLLAVDPEPRVRARLAESSRELPVDVIRLLAADPDPSVRQGLAELSRDLFPVAPPLQKRYTEEVDSLHGKGGG
jgi:hypothetical protein